VTVASLTPASSPKAVTSKARKAAASRPKRGK
jgi:hypothetical protein